jgi:uncharacterized protein involved in outer membrane biogenesis
MDPNEFNPDRRPAANPPHDRPRLPRLWGKWLSLPLAWRIVAVVLTVILAMWLVLLVTKGRFLKYPAERLASAVLAREVRVGGDFQLYLAPFDLKFHADDLTVANPPWAGPNPFFAARSIDMRVASLPLLWGRRTIKDLKLDDAAIDLRWSQDGRFNSWTFGDPNAPPRPLAMPDLRQARIDGTVLRYVDPRFDVVADFKVDRIEAADTAIADAIGFVGQGRIRRLPFSLTGELLTPNATIAGGANRLRVAAQSGATHLAIAGTLPGPTQVEGAKLRVGARGPDLSLLFDFLGVAVPETRPYRLNSALTYRSGEWRFTDVKGVYGESDLAGRMTFSYPKDRLLIDANLRTDRLHIIDIAPFVGYEPERLESRGAAGLVTQVAGTPRLLPDAPLRVDAISRFDAKVDYTVRTVVDRNLPIGDIGLKLDLDHGRLALTPLTFVMAGGLFAADVVIDARTSPVRTDYDLRLSPTPMGKLLSRWGVEESGTSGTIRGRIQLTGTGDNVRQSLATSNGRIAIVLPKGTMWARNIQLSEIDVGVFIQKMFEDKLQEPVEINCGLIAFTVRAGIASADPILIDTTKNVIVGRGAFSFRDESLEMVLRADGKKFSLFSGQSPIALDGFFAAPAIDPISPDLIGRAGAGIALGSVLSPLAAVLAFVDVGDAKAADCGPVLAGANARAQQTAKGKPRDDVGRGTPSRREDGR